MLFWLYQSTSQIYGVSFTLSTTFEKPVGVGVNESFEGEIKGWQIEDKFEKVIIVQKLW